MMEVKLDNNIMKVKKQGTDVDMAFELHAFGETKMMMSEIKAFKIDADSMSECMYFIKYFGPYQISKTNEDKFVFSKGGDSVLVSKSGW